MSNEHKASTPPWREFEQLAAEIQRQLAPQAKVETNVKLRGKRSGEERQIDILVEQGVGQYAIRVVIDCKDYKTPVDVKDVEAFMGLVEDVGANKGAMITASGSSSTAKQRAKDAGIDLYKLVDTRDTKWKTYVSIPCVIRDAFIESFQFTFSGTGNFKLEMQDFHYMPVFRADGSLIDYLSNLVLERWRSDDIPASPGLYQNILAAKEETFVRTSGMLYKVGMTFKAVVVERLHFGQLPVETTSGLNDELRGDYITNGFTTGPINFTDVENTWERIGSIEQLAVKPVIVLNFKSMPPRFQGGVEPKG